ncbi:MAG: pentapeptide repeat-containing protein [Pyrinomonadaceae bacterium]
MTNEPKQKDLFDWKPDESKSLWFFRILKSTAVWLIVGFIVILFLIWLKFDTVMTFFASDFYSKNSLILIGTLSLILTLLSIWLIPRWQVKSLNTKKGNTDQSEFDLEKERIKLRDDTRKTLAQIIGGIFFVAGLFVTFNTFELNRQGQQLAREGQVSERFSKAVELLGNKDISVRIGGLYSLEQISREYSQDYHTKIMEILAAFIREKSKEQRESSEETKVVKINTKQDKNGQEEKSKYFNMPSTTDVRVAVTIINRRNLELENDKAIFVFNLSDSNLVDANLANANLSHANLANANLSGANLSFANLSYANLQYAIFNDDSYMIGANLRGAILQYANLNEVTLDVADLYNANLSYADLRQADLRSCTGLRDRQIDYCIIDEKTQLPDELLPRRLILLELSKQNLEERKKMLIKSQK